MCLPGHGPGIAIRCELPLAPRRHAPRVAVRRAAAAAGLIAGGAGLALAAAALPLAAGPLRCVLRGGEGVDLIGTLAATGRLLAAYGITVAAGFWIAAALA